MASIASSWRPIALRNWPKVPSASTELALRATAWARSASAPSQSQSYSIFTRPSAAQASASPSSRAIARWAWRRAIGIASSTCNGRNIAVDAISR